jgi:putative copper resistance protein D
MMLVLRFVHVLAAVTWIGGMVFIALVLVPTLRGLDDATLRSRLVQDAGIRFRRVAWIALALLLISGLGNLWMRPYLLGLPHFQIKLGLVGTALALSALHDFVLGPRAGQPDADPRLRVRASWLARGNVIVVLLVVLLGLMLRG